MVCVDALHTVCVCRKDSFSFALSSGNTILQPACAVLFGFLLSHLGIMGISSTIIMMPGRRRRGLCRQRQRSGKHQSIALVHSTCFSFSSRRQIKTLKLRAALHSLDWLNWEIGSCISSVARKKMCGIIGTKKIYSPPCTRSYSSTRGEKEGGGGHCVEDGDGFPSCISDSCADRGPMTLLCFLKFQVMALY